MSNTASFLDALHGIGSRIDEDMSEKDIENAFLISKSWKPTLTRRCTTYSI